MIVEIGLCGVAAFLFGRGIYHSGVLSGWIAQGLRQPAPAPSLPPSEPPRFDVEAHEIALFRAVPSAWWLDPNRWGDNPHWDKKQPSSPSSPPRPLIVGKAPVAGSPIYVEPPKTIDCPSCRQRDQVVVTIEHGDQANEWECSRCRLTFNRKNYLKLSKGGPPKKPKKQRAAPSPGPTELPCGCEGNGSITRYTTGSTTWTRCGRCQKWWEPRSNDPTGRWLAQGEHVHDRDDIAPNAQAAWDRVVAKGLENHGVCPSLECQFPVAKRGDYYYCTNTDCHRHYGGWK